MTTIVSNGYHLFVDKRTTIPHNLTLTGYGETRTTTRIEHTSDLCSKLVIPTNWKYKGKKITAATAAGKLDEMESIYKSLDKASVEVVVDVIGASGLFNHAFKEGLGVVLLTEDFHTVNITVNSKGLRLNCNKPGVTVVTGGGISNFNAMKKFIDKKDLFKIRPLDVFLYSTSRSDLWSSQAFDHFDNVFLKSFKNLRPASRSVLASIDRLNKLIDLNNAVKASENEQNHAGNQA